MKIFEIGFESLDKKAPPNLNKKIHFKNLYNLDYLKLERMSKHLLDFLVDVEKMKRDKMHDEFYTDEMEFNGQVDN